MNDQTTMFLVMLHVGLYDCESSAPLRAFQKKHEAEHFANEEGARIGRALGKLEAKRKLLESWDSANSAPEGWCKNSNLDNCECSNCAWNIRSKAESDRLDTILGDPLKNIPMFAEDYFSLQVVAIPFGRVPEPE